MRGSGFLWLCVAAGLSLPLAAHAGATPIDLAAQFTPPHSAHAVPAVLAAATCAVRIDDVSDTRADPQAMGSIGGRPVRAADSAAWLRSGLQTLSGNPPPAGDDSDLVLSANLFKAYIMSMTTEKTVNVVLHVRYSRKGAVLAEQDYRGSETSVNWISGEGETQSAFDDALAQILAAVAVDIAAHCK